MSAEECKRSAPGQSCGLSVVNLRPRVIEKSVICVVEMGLDGFASRFERVDQRSGVRLRDGLVPFSEVSENGDLQLVRVDLCLGVNSIEVDSGRDVIRKFGSCIEG